MCRYKKIWLFCNQFCFSRILEVNKTGKPFGQNPKAVIPRKSFRHSGDSRAGVDKGIEGAGKHDDEVNALRCRKPGMLPKEPRGTAALQVFIDHRCHGRRPLLADSLEGYAPS